MCEVICSPSVRTGSGIKDSEGEEGFKTRDLVADWGAAAAGVGRLQAGTFVLFAR